MCLERAGGMEVVVVVGLREEEEEEENRCRGSVDG